MSTTTRVMTGVKTSAQDRCLARSSGEERWEGVSKMSTKREFDMLERCKACMLVVEGKKEGCERESR